MATEKLANDLFDQIGWEKSLTIRAGARAIEPGPLEFIPAEPTDEIDPIEVTVTQSVIKRLKDVTDEEARQGNYTSGAELVLSLLRFDPHLTPESVVTIVHFSEVDYLPF